MIQKVVIFDRDNTLIKDKGYTYKTRDLKFLPQTIRSIKFLSKNNVKMFIVTNQSGIAKGFFSLKDLKKFHSYINKRLSKYKVKINGFLFCPHHKNGVIKKFSFQCKCRKPENLLIEKVKKKFKKKANIVMFGDKISDRKAAKKSKIKFFYRKKNFFDQIKSVYKNHL